MTCLRHILIGCLLFLSSNGPVLAQEISDDPGAEFTTATVTSTGVLRMQFLDSETGTAVQPDAVLVNGRPTPDSSADAGVLAVELPTGRFEVQVEAKGYQPFAATAVVDGENTMVQSFELDPKPDTEETEEPELTDDEGALTGYVVDSLNGMPLNGAEVAIEEKGESIVTGAVGKYELIVPLSAPRPRGTGSDTVLDGEALTVRVAKDGYQTQVHRNVEVLRGQRRIHTFRLESIDDDTVTSEPKIMNAAPERRGERRRDWMFDVTID